ncbi:hypothetical protein AYK24_00400 [Thermoplasmatales archaeon SG8-52-4]|nr:MAG: hypothetical protein AYK24_00400 [Thermoplasmatales archaeon SG8-52-4]
MKTNYAEIKPPKFGETLTHNGDGNPELSSLARESVEARRAVCMRCGNELPKRKRKFCSTKCSSAFHSYNWRVKHGFISKPGVGSGGNQFGTTNHMYKNGIRNFSKRAFDHYDKKCNRCDSVNNLLTHHIDKDRTNNDLSNLEILCKSCHQKHHCTRNPITGRYIKG